MALYKDPSHFNQSSDSAFDTLHAPGSAAPHPGIYKCIACGDEIAIAGGHVLPPQNHKQHSPGQGQIKWKLIAFPQQRK